MIITTYSMLSQHQAALTEIDFIICVKNITMAFLHVLKDFFDSVADSELTVRIGTRIRSSIKLQGTYEYYVRSLISFTKKQK